MSENTGCSWITRGVAVVLAASIIVSGCSQTSQITTEPEGARIKVNGIYLGETPASYRYRSGLPETYILEIEKEGYKKLSNATIDRTLRADESLVLLLLAIVPYFFSARLEDQYVFPLEPEEGTVIEETTEN